MGKISPLFALSIRGSGYVFGRVCRFREGTKPWPRRNGFGIRRLRVLGNRSTGIAGALLDVLPSFDGRPTEEVLSAIATERNIHNQQGLVRKLVDFKILVPGPPLG
jgi:hypothetical protein